MNVMRYILVVLIGIKLNRNHCVSGCESNGLENKFCIKFIFFYQSKKILDYKMSNSHQKNGNDDSPTPKKRKTDDYDSVKNLTPTELHNAIDDRGVFIVKQGLKIHMMTGCEVLTMIIPPPPSVSQHKDDSDQEILENGKRKRHREQKPNMPIVFQTSSKALRYLQEYGNQYRYFCGKTGLYEKLFSAKNGKKMYNYLTGDGRLDMEEETDVREEQEHTAIEKQKELKSIRKDKPSVTFNPNVKTKIIKSDEDDDDDDEEDEINSDDDNDFDEDSKSSNVKK